MNRSGPRRVGVVSWRDELVPRAFAVVAAYLVLAASLAVMYGCDFSPLEQEPPVLLEGSLTPVHPDLSVAGNAAAVTQFGNTETSILVMGLDPEEDYAWRLRSGTCTGEEEAIVSPDVFPILQPGEDGEASGMATFSVSLVPGREYAVDVAERATGGRGVVACGDMMETK